MASLARLAPVPSEHPSFVVASQQELALGGVCILIEGVVFNTTPVTMLGCG